MTHPVATFHITWKHGQTCHDAFIGSLFGTGSTIRDSLIALSGRLEEGMVITEGYYIMKRRKPIHVLIVDDHPLVRAGLRQLITDEPDFEVYGETGSVWEAVRMVKQSPPDLAIVDISLADGSGLDLIKRIRAAAPSVRILVASMHDESVFAERAVRAGAMGYVNKQEVAENVIKAVRRILEGKLYLSPRMTDQVLLKSITGGQQNEEGSSLNRLSDREMEVFDLIGRGLGTSQIAARLSLSIKTIETHRAHIKKKLHLQSANELTMRAVQWALEHKSP